MTSQAENSVSSGGIELSGLVAITHAVDEQKNRNTPQRKNSKRKKTKRRNETPPEQNDKLQSNDDDNDDEDRPVIDYLA